MSDKTETADAIMQRYEREAKELRAKAQDELDEVAKAEHATGLADRELRREQLYGAYVVRSLRIIESRRVEMEKWSGDESWLWTREELRADGWIEVKDQNGNIRWERGL